jgi:peroxiredoxin
MGNPNNRKAPDFSLQNTEGKQVTLSDIIGEKQIILLFFPLAFSPTCTDEMCMVRDNMKLYNSLDARVIGISVDSFFTLKAFKKAENINFMLLSDFNKDASRNYGVLYDDLLGMHGVSKRAVFVINKVGEIIHSEILEDVSKVPDFKAIQQILKQN